MSVAEVKPGYEKVFTVTDYYDGPRQGVANFKGEPHFYDCIFDETRNDYSNLYQLTPVSPHVFDLAMEDWAIWERWESAFHAGSTTRENPSSPTPRQSPSRRDSGRSGFGSQDGKGSLHRSDRFVRGAWKSNTSQRPYTSPKGQVDGAGT